MPSNIVDVILQLQDKFSGNASAAAGAASGLLGTMHQLNGAVELIGKVGSAAMGAFNSTIKEGIALNSKYAQTQIQIAGTLKAFDLTETFQQGKEASSAIYGLMEQLAAPLPGSVDDYVNVFQKSLPGAIKAFQAKGGGSMKDIASFTSNFAAVAIANNVDAAQAAADIPRLLGGQAGADVVAYGKLRGLIEKSAKDIGLAASNAEEFNKLKPEQRLAVMQKVVEGSKETIDAFSNTLDAQEGTLESVKNNFLRTFSAPVYEAAVKGLTSVNAWLDKNKAGISALAQLIGDKLGGAIEFIGQLVTKVFGGLQTALGGAVTAMSSISGMQRGVGLNEGGQGTGTGMGGGNVDAIVTTLTGLMGLISPGFTLLATVVQALASNTQFVNALFAGLGTVVQLVVPLLTYVGAAFQIIGDLIASILAPIILGLVQAITTVLTYLMPIFDILLQNVMMVVDFLKPPLVFLVEALMTLINGIVDFVMPIIAILVAGFTAISGVVMTVLSPVFDALAFTIGSLISGIGKALSWLGKLIGESLGVDTSGKAQTKKAELAGLEAFKNFKFPEMKSLDVKTMDLDKLKLPPGEAPAGAKKAAKGAKAPGQRAGTVNDFRNSKFDITQKFAEGFDPDRIAAAFTEDLSRMADMRLDSSLATPFSTR